MAREPARDGVDAEPDLDAPLAQLVGQVGDGVLRLGDRHPVAGRDDDDAGVLQQIRDVDGVGLTVLAVVGVVGGGDRLEPNPPAMTETKDRFMAWHMM